MDTLFIIVVFAIIGWVVYFSPAFIAFKRTHPNRWPILIINIVFGGTGIGWLAALVWALRAVHRPVGLGQSDGGQSGLNLFVNDTKPIVLVANDGQWDIRDEPSAVAQIERLIRLRDTAHISAAEYEQLKSAILAH